MTNETLMTFASLAFALVAGVALLYSAFVAAYLVDLLTGRGVPPLRFFGTVLVAAASSSAVAAMWRLRKAL